MKRYFFLLPLACHLLLIFSCLNVSDVWAQKKLKKQQRSAKSLSQKKQAISSPQPQILGTFGSWQALQMLEGSQKVCYMVAYPVTQKQKIQNRKRPYLMITHRPDQFMNVFCHFTGDQLHKDHKATITIKGQKKHKVITLFSENDTLWTPDTQTDEILIKLMTTWGKTLNVNSHSNKDIQYNDQYALIGASKAYQTITTACSKSQIAHSLENKKIRK